MTTNLEDMRRFIAELGAIAYARFLTDTAGGNISARVGDAILMTPRYAGSRYLWRLRPEQILVLDLEGNKQEGEGEVSREYRVHCKLLNEFYPDGAAVFHGHARNVLVFCAALQPIPPVLYATEKFGVIEHVQDAPAHSQDLADNIAAAMQPLRDRLRKQAAAVLAPKHGLFVLGRNLEAAFDAAERIEGNAYCILMSRFLVAP
ncbi:MAG: class II aldolase/adducin family protein [Caldilineales bacterium]|nr:class II aldolase/adducin family protein [Caldilineales bacterium]MDW8318196.1 class II aldolase/adducin family protein [Anaerolineae bacterium]